LFIPKSAFTSTLSTIFVTFAILLTIFLSTLAGYGFGRKRYNFKYRGWLFALCCASSDAAAPNSVYTPIYNDGAPWPSIRWSLVLLYAALGLPVSTYLMATYF
jgi:ABC-type glycerol-3-phosphate transport system permease component